MSVVTISVPSGFFADGVAVGAGVGVGAGLDVAVGADVGVGVDTVTGGDVGVAATVGIDVGLAVGVGVEVGALAQDPAAMMTARRHRIANALTILFTDTSFDLSLCLIP